MAYYLGRDVVVAITTEDVTLGVDVSDSGVIATYAVGTGPSAGTDISFAGPRAKKNIVGSPSALWTNANFTVFGTQAGSAVTYKNEVADVIGIDIGIGATDEDISAFGLRTAGKVEIKKETTISITRKKNNKSWEIAFNEARHGVESANKYFGYGTVGHVNPGRADYGYRVFLKLKTDGETIALPNCCITGHTLSLNVDGTTEETLELYCYLTPTITLGTVDANTDHSGNETVF